MLQDWSLEGLSAVDPTLDPDYVQGGPGLSPPTYTPPQQWDHGQPTVPRIAETMTVQAGGLDWTQLAIYGGLALLAITLISGRRR